MKKLRFLRITAAISLIMVLLVVIHPLPAYAIANPDSATTIGTVELYEDLLETGDLGVLFDFETFYATLPTETVTEAYVAAFNDTDGVTHLKTTVPYTLLNKGYGVGMAWLYFSAAEVTAGSIDVADIALYRVEVYGNAALGWIPGPAPSTVDTIDTWNTTGDSHVLLSVDVMTYADTLEAEWELHMVKETPIGDRLTTYGETYFENVMSGARTLATAAFYTDESGPIQEDEIDKEMSFGATMTDGTGTCTGSPITLTSGANTVTVTVAGTFLIELDYGTVGTAASGTGTVNGSPVTLREGVNTITVPGGGTGDITVTVQLQNTQTRITDTVTGTGFDLTALATLFGMSRLAFSGFVWLLISIIICAASYDRAGGKTTLLVFDICIIGGTLLGMVPMLAAVLLFIGFGFFSAYVFFFRGANA